MINALSTGLKLGTHFLNVLKQLASARAVQVLLFVALFSALGVIAPKSAFAQTKSLKLYYIHTGEKATITYKKNGKYIASGLKKINWHLRDWRRNEPTKMDPKLLDLVWEVYRRSGSKAYITVISGYRSPASNNLLRKRGRGVAKNSQHTLGKALDFYLPDVKLSKLREIGLKMEVGGVGYYPTSGSPFVHLDVGRVRHWPRMSRKELVAVFPKGDTMHVPSDGKPLARYEQAVAAYKRRSASGKLVPEGKPTAKELNFFQRLAQNTKDDEEDDAGNDAVVAPRAVSTTVKTTAPKPAPDQAPEPAEPVVASRETEFAALPANIPVPILAPRQNAVTSGEAIAVAALPTPVENPITPEPETQQVDEPAIAESPQEEETLAETTVLANIPVPSKRPEFETVLAAVEEQVAQPREETTNVLALTEPEKPAVDNMQVAALTPQEIEDLRALTRPTIPVTPLRAPTPAANVGNSQSEITPQVASSVPAPVTNPVEQKPASEDNAITVAALEPVAEPPVAADVTAPVPVAIEPLPLEPGTKSTGEIIAPEQNPVVKEQIEIAALEQEKAEAAAETAEQNAILASLPVPTRRPQTEDEAEIVIASLDEQPAVQNTSVAAEPAVESVEAPAADPIADQIASQLPSRQISLDAYSAPQNNSSTIGQLALASEKTIREFAEVQAPAYGRNIIRKVPGTILVQGFNLTPYGPGQNSFSGKAVTAMRFAKLELK